MFELLLYSGMMCADADALMLRIQETAELSPKIVIELVETVKESVPECSHYGTQTTEGAGRKSLLQESIMNTLPHQEADRESTVCTTLKF